MLRATTTLFFVLLATARLAAEAEPAQVSPHPELPCERITRLRAQLAADGPGALKAFWAELGQSGAPLIEPSARDPDHALATFVWKGSSGTRNVVVEPFLRDPQYDYALRHLGGTDVWFTTIRTRARGRFVYRIGENVPVFPNTFPDTRCDPRAQAQFESAMGRDPLNPLSLPPFSLVIMPGASAEPWIAAVPNGRQGTTRRTTFRSRGLSNERQLTIYTPAGYDPSGPPRPLLLVFDEDRYRSLIPLATILDNLTAAGRIPPLVAVMVGNPSRAARMVELPCNPSFVEFLSGELVPWIRKNYRVTSDPRRVIVAGSSYGGLASAYAALQHPEIFGNVLSQSGSYGWTPPPDPAKPRDFNPEQEKNYVAGLYLAVPALPVRFYLDVGSEEIDYFQPGARNLIPNRHFRDVLRAKGEDVIYREFVGGHDEASWRAMLPDALIALAGPWVAPAVRPE